MSKMFLASFVVLALFCSVTSRPQFAFPGQDMFTSQIGNYAPAQVSSFVQSNNNSSGSSGSSMPNFGGMTNSIGGFMPGVTTTTTATPDAAITTPAAAVTDAAPARKKRGYQEWISEQMETYVPTGNPLAAGGDIVPTGNPMEALTG